MARNILIERLPNNSYALLVPGSRENTKDEKFIGIQRHNYEHAIIICDLVIERHADSEYLYNYRLFYVLQFTL